MDQSRGFTEATSWNSHSGVSPEASAHRIYGQEVAYMHHPRIMSSEIAKAVKLASAEGNEILSVPRLILQYMRQYACEVEMAVLIGSVVMRRSAAPESLSLSLFDLQPRLPGAVRDRRRSVVLGGPYAAR